MSNYCHMRVPNILICSWVSQGSVLHWVLKQMCDGPALGLFRFEELELLVCGLPHFDFSSLKSGAKVMNLCKLLIGKKPVDFVCKILKIQIQTTSRWRL